MFTVQNSLDQLQTSLYYGAMTLMKDFQQYLGNMGTELFGNQYIQAILLFFQFLANSLLIVGLVLAFFEYAVSIESGKANIKDTLLSILKAMSVTAVFTTVPVKLYQLSVDVTSAISSVMNVTMLKSSVNPSGTVPNPAVSQASLFNDSLNVFTNMVVNNPIMNPAGAISNMLIDNAASMAAGSEQQHVPDIVSLIFLIAFAYGFLKVLFGNIKRGGIMLIQICVCSLYIFSLVRGYSDAFINWCKQVVALCFTAFVQNLMLIGGLLIFPHQMVVGVGLMLAAAEVPRIAQSFGMETSMKGNLSGITHTANSVMSLGKVLMKVGA